jgi:hypothetical protein
MTLLSWHALYLARVKAAVEVQDIRRELDLPAVPLSDLVTGDALRTPVSDA